jgi:hypothetical protein
MCICVIIFISCLFTTFVNAVTFKAYCNICGTADSPKEHSFNSNLEADAFASKHLSITRNIFSKTDPNEKLSVEAIVEFDIENEFKDLWALTSSVYDNLLPIGYVMVLIYFFVELGEKVMRDAMSAEQLMQGFIKLAGMLILLTAGKEIMAWGIELSSGIYELLQGANFSSVPTGSCPYNQIKGASAMELMGIKAECAGQYMVLLISQFIFKIILWKRCLTIVLRVLLAPIGMADLANGGTNSQGFIYFKKTVALLMQGTIIFAANIAYNLAVETVASGFISFALILASYISIVVKSEGLSNQVMGV